MFIAHVPAGCLVTSILLVRSGRSGGALLLAGLAGAIAPDLDLLYFYFVDGRAHHHHAYPTHFPLAWLVLLAAVTAVAGRRGRDGVAGVQLFALNGLLHLVLDSVAGDVRWLAPFSASAFSLLVVPALYSPWWLNFILHGSFALELAICVLALLRLRQSSGRGSAGRAR